MQLGAAGEAAGELGINLGRGLVVLGTKGRIVLPVPFAQQHFEHDGLLWHVVSQLSIPTLSVTSRSAHKRQHETLCNVASQTHLATKRVSCPASKSGHVKQLT